MRNLVIVMLVVGMSSAAMAVVQPVRVESSDFVVVVMVTGAEEVMLSPLAGGKLA